MAIAFVGNVIGTWAVSQNSIRDLHNLLYKPLGIISQWAAATAAAMGREPSTHWFFKVTNLMDTAKGCNNAVAFIPALKSDLIDLPDDSRAYVVVHPNGRDERKATLEYRSLAWKAMRIASQKAGFAFNALDSIFALMSLEIIKLSKQGERNLGLIAGTVGIVGGLSGLYDEYRFYNAVKNTPHQVPQQEDKATVPSYFISKGEKVNSKLKMAFSVSSVAFSIACLALTLLEKGSPSKNRYGVYAFYLRLVSNTCMVGIGASRSLWEKLTIPDKRRMQEVPTRG